MNGNEEQFNIGFEKEEIISFLRWTATATEDELNERNDQLHQLLARLSERSVIFDVKWCIKQIDKEITARFDLYNSTKKKGA